MAVKLSFHGRKWLLKCYWKVENVVEVQRCWMIEIGTSPPQPPPPPTTTTTRIMTTLKNTMYATNPQTLEKLRDQIEHAINDIPLATIRTVCRSVRRRCWECTVAEGGHLDVYGLKEVQGIEHKKNCISVSFCC